MNTYPSLGKMLVALREREKQSQAGLARSLAHVAGCSQGAIWGWERDDYAPDAGQLEGLLRVLNASPEESAAARELAYQRRVQKAAGTGGAEGAA